MFANGSLLHVGRKIRRSHPGLPEEVLLEGPPVLPPLPPFLHPAVLLSGPKQPGPQVDAAPAAVAQARARPSREPLSCLGRRERNGRGPPAPKARRPGRGGLRAHREVLEAGEGEGTFFVQQESGQVHCAASHRTAKVEGKGRSCKGLAGRPPPPVHLPPCRPAAGHRPRSPLPSRDSGGRGRRAGARLFLFRPGRPTRRSPHGVGTPAARLVLRPRRVRPAFTSRGRVAGESARCRKCPPPSSGRAALNSWSHRVTELSPRGLL